MRKICTVSPGLARPLTNSVSLDESRARRKVKEPPSLLKTEKDRRAALRSSGCC